MEASETLPPVITAGPRFLLQAVVRTVSPISFASHVHMEGKGVIGGPGGAPLPAVGILVVGAGVVPHPANDEGKAAVPLLSAAFLCDGA